MVAGGLSGVVAGIFGSIVLQLIDSTQVLTEAIPALIGLPTPVLIAGWLLFIMMGVGAGLFYAGLLTAVGRNITAPDRGALAGALYGVVLWVLVAVVFVPVATTAVGYADAPPFPYIEVVTLASYVGYGVIIGAFYAAIAGYRSTSADSSTDVAL